MNFSIIIPVYNRPDELAELLQSILEQESANKTEIIVIDDGSEIGCNHIVNKYKEKLNLKYCFKKNSGPGDSRNYGMERASGTYFVILDSDCVLPSNFLATIDNSLTKDYADAYGGPDAAHDSFTAKQKAINYSMTSFLTTGGLRGAEKSSKEFQVRSFNMGLSKKAFILTKGFAKQRIGEDIDLNFRLKKHHCTTRFIPEAFVYHKRRTSWFDFFRQTRSFGAARPILNKMHPGSSRIIYWLPSLFVLGFVFSLFSLALDFYVPAIIYAVYMVSVGVDSYMKNKRFPLALLSMLAVFIQFFGYGSGFLRSIFRLYVQRMTYREAFPKMFS